MKLWHILLTAGMLANFSAVCHGQPWASDDTRSDIAKSAPQLANPNGPWTPPSGQDAYVLERDFSLATKPPRAWSYGYASTLGGAFFPFRAATTNFSDEGIPIETWSIDGFGPSAVYHNATTNTAAWQGRGEVFPPGGTIFHPGADAAAPDQYCVIRFTVPHGRDGRYFLRSRFDDYLTGPFSGNIDFHLLLGGQSVYQEYLPGNAASGVSGFMELAAGDVIDFVVGRQFASPGYNCGLKIHVSFTPVTSDAAPPTIAAQPQSQTNSVHSDVTFLVTAAGSAPLSYQWHFRAGFTGFDLPGATNSTLTLRNLSRTNAGNYSVTVTNDFGAATSDAALLTVLPSQLLGHYSLFEDFSLASNPNGVWSYGFAPVLGGQFDRFSVASQLIFYDINYFLRLPVATWSNPGENQPTVFCNLNSETAVGYAGFGVFPPGTLWFGPGGHSGIDDVGVIRLTVPLGGGGDYQLACAVHDFMNVLSSDNDFHVMKNGVELMGQLIPQNSGISYARRLTLEAGDTVDFVGGRGLNFFEPFIGVGRLKIQATLDRVEGP
jgi:hypothetical protein